MKYGVDEITRILTDWKSKVEKLDEVFDTLDMCVNVADTKLFDAAYKIAESYTQELSKKLCGDDEMLMWFWLESDLGASPKACSVGVGENALKYKPDSVESLANLIYDYNAFYNS